MNLRHGWVVIVFGILIPTAGVADRTPGTGITGSAHDFSDNTSWNATGEICKVCHVPHDGAFTETIVGFDPAAGDWPPVLWNHQLSSEEYIMYSSDTIDGTIDTQPTGISKLCLGCHDGTVALDQFGGNIGATTTTFIPDFLRVPFQTGDLRGTHPISITYVGPTIDPGLNDVTTVFPGTNVTIEDVLWDNKVQCASCHDVHNSPGETLAVPLLRASQTDPPSGLCLTCHNK